MTDEPEIIDAPAEAPEDFMPADLVEADEVVEQTGLAVRESPAEMRPMTLADGMSLLPVEQQKQVLAEYDARRVNFRRWLLSHMQEGVHYGVPPGCEVRLDDQGNIVQRRGKDWIVVPKTQWQSKPSLYKPGAWLLVDLLRLEAIFEPDEQLRAQMKPDANTFVLKCTLQDPTTHKRLGEGRGAYSVGEKGANTNTALKMAEKCAVVDAVLNTLALSDLFTQDREDAVPPPREQPEPDENAPTTPTRAERQGPPTDIFKRAEFLGLKEQYKAARPGGTKEAFLGWASQIAGVDLHVTSNWTLAAVQKCVEALS